VATFSGTSKDDILFVSARSSLDELLGLAGNDYLDATTGGGNNTLRGGDGNDELYAYASDQLFGDAGSDELYSDGNGANTLYGGDANDTLFADSNDFVFGDAGDDLIFGGFGANQLTGGLGEDSFYLTPNGVPDIPNQILDFSKDDDTILVTAIPEVQSFADLTRVQVGADTFLRANVGGVVRDLGILKNIQADTLAPIVANRPPVADPDKTLTLLEDAAPTSLGIMAATDLDGDPLTILVEAIPDSTKGQVRLSNGTVVTNGDNLTLAQLTSLVFVPSANANGNAGAFRYRVEDGRGGTAAQTITINITPDGNGGSFGDPHIFTFDGFHYDFQATGDFFLVKAEDSDLQVQVRQTPWIYNPAATINTGLATEVDGNRVEFYYDQALPLVNHLPLFLELGQSQALGQGSISRSSIAGYGMQGDLYTITYPTGDVLSNAVFNGFLMDPTLDLANSRHLGGLLGNNNGNPEDDIALRDGTVLINPLAPENLYGAFADSWQVTAQESLFSRAFGSDTPNTLPEHNELAALAQRFVFGGNGDDILLGVAKDSILANPDMPQVDLFMGNKGADTFVLGDRNGQFYSTSGLQDYALITDFWAEDKIQLHGTASDYMLGIAPAHLAHGTGIFLAQDPAELIGIIQGDVITNLELANSGSFVYV
jgi:hypothetical protein